MSYARFVLVLAAAVLLFSTAASAVVSIPAPALRPIRLAGTILEVNLEKSAIVLSPLAPGDSLQPPQPITFFVNDKTRIFKNGVAAPLSALEVGDICKAAVVPTPDGTLVALTVCARTPQPPIVTVSGKIVKLDHQNAIVVLEVPACPMCPAFRTMLFYYDRSTKITKNGVPTGPEGLAIGDLARVAYAQLPAMDPGKPIRAIAIDARTPPEQLGRVCGKLVELNLDTGVIGVLPSDVDCADGTDCVRRFQVTDRTVIVKFERVPLEALRIDDRVCVTFLALLDVYPPPATEVVVQPEGFGGTVASVDPAAGIITLKKSPMGPEFPFKVVEKTKIIKNGEVVPLEAIKPGDTAEVKYFVFEEGNVAAAIMARSPRPPLPPR